MVISLQKPFFPAENGNFYTHSYWLQQEGNSLSGLLSFSILFNIPNLSLSNISVAKIKTNFRMHWQGSYVLIGKTQGRLLGFSFWAGLHSESASMWRWLRLQRWKWRDLLRWVMYPSHIMTSLYHIIHFFLSGKNTTTFKRCRPISTWKKWTL